MALPKRRWSTHRQGKKRKSLGLKLPTLITCSNCQALTLPHRVCASCGYYKGKQYKITERKKVRGKTDKKTRNTETLKDTEALKKRKGR